MRSKKDSILYIDAKIGNTLIFKNLFDNYYTIFTSKSEAEGLKLIERYPIKLVIVNTILPQLSELKIVKMAKRIWADIKPILMASCSPAAIQNSTKKDIKVLRFTSNPFVANYVNYEEILNLIQEAKKIGFSYN